MDWSVKNRILDNVLESIGYTPLVRINKLAPDISTEICVKLEFTNPSGSLKDRVVYQIVTEAEKRGELKQGMILLEGTTGNTGISTAMVGAALGYRVMIVMPEGMSEERKKTIRAYGAELILTPGAETDVDLVLEEVEKIKAEYGKQIFEIGQFYRNDNLMAHIDNTAPEIWEQCQGQIDAFVMCQGTGGTVSGTALYLKEKNPNLKIYISEPAESPMLAYGKIGQHMVQGIADGLIPKILDLNVVDGIVLIPSDECINTAQKMAGTEGIFCGISSGCNVAAAIKVAKAHPELKRIVTMVNDNGLRYLSTPLCGTEDQRQKLDRNYALSQKDIEKLQQYQFEIIK
ncbi:MAG: cysteine synthase family protein [Bacillota bacterium]|nr:cysteine synthase family protein [Bacillota bacterium]